MNVEILQKIRNMMADIDQIVNAIQIHEASDREWVAGALFDVAADQAKGIHTCLENHLYASALALRRPLFESFIRGAWILYCASDSEFDRFLSNDKLLLDGASRPATVKQLVIEVEGQRKSLAPHLSDMWELGGDQLNSATHGGVSQIFNRYDGHSIEPHISAEDKEKLARYSGMFAFLAFLQMVDIARDKITDQQAEFLARDVTTWLFRTPKS